VRGAGYMIREAGPDRGGEAVWVRSGG